MHGTDPRAGEHRNGGLRNVREINDDTIAFFYFVSFQDIREAANFAVQLLIGKGTFVAGFAFPDNCRFVPARPSQMPIQAVFRNVEFAADEPLRERRLPFEDLFPICAPD
jgi:hypothetical protein